MRFFRVMRLGTALLGICASLAAAGAVSRLTIEIPDALGAAFGSSQQQSVRLLIFFQGRRAAGVLVIPTARNPALAAWDARDVKSSLNWKGDTLEGSVEAMIHAAGSNAAAAWACAIKGKWKEGVLSGRAELGSGNTGAVGREFTARAEPIVVTKGNDGFVELFLPPVDGGRGVRAGIVFHGGKAVAAASFSPLVHPVWQRIDASKLSLKSGRLSGRLQWVPDESGPEKSKKPPEPVELKADLRSGFGFLSGGTKGGMALLSPVPGVPARAEVELAFDAPLAGDERWRRRAVVRLNLSGDSVSATTLFNGRPESGWSGTADSVSFHMKDGRLFEGTLESTIASATVQPGLYQIRFKGDIVGSWLVGSFESELAGEAAATGSFTGWLAPAPR